MQKETFKNPLLLFAILVAIVSIIFVTSRIGNAQDKKNWNDVQSANSERNRKVRQSYVTGLISDYKSADIRREYYKSMKDSTGPDFVPIPIDPNLVAAFSWFTDGEKWRLDLRRVYPEIGQDFK